MTPENQPSQNNGLEKIVSYDNISNLEKSTKWTILVSIFFYFLLLSFIPAWNDAGDFGSSWGILFIGWLGLFIGIISWYWFIPTFFFVRAVFTESYFNWGLIKKSLLVIFYTACIIPLFLFIRVGEIAPGDIDCRCQFIKSLDGGYYLYILLIGYLLSLTIFLKKITNIFKIVSYIFMILGICIFTYFKLN